jgi:hypothetical protein
MTRIALGRNHDSGHVWAKSPDFSAFPCLETLSMSGFNIVTNDDLSDANLRHITLSFKRPEVWGESHRHDFQKGQAIWMKEFAKLKAEQYPNSKLNKTDIIFNPNPLRETSHNANKTWRCLLAEDLENALDLDGKCT